MTGGAAHTNSLPFTRSRLGSAWGHTVNNHNTAHCHLGATACPAYLSSHTEKLPIYSVVNICCSIRWAGSGCQTSMAQGLLLHKCFEHVTGYSQEDLPHYPQSNKQKCKTTFSGGGLCFGVGRRFCPGAEPSSLLAFTSSYAKHVLSSSNSSTVCCCGTFFLHFGLTVTFMFICSMQLWSIWRGRLPSPSSPRSLFFPHPVMTKISIHICMPQWLSFSQRKEFLGTREGKKTPLQLHRSGRGVKLDLLITALMVMKDMDRIIGWFTGNLILLTLVNVLYGMNLHKN